jgi:NAD(P)H-dependent nitrite reductase small subunit
MAGFVRVALRTEIPDGSSRCVEVAGKRIALFRLGDTFYAIEDACPHADGPLSEGSVEGEEVECPWHGSRFNLRTGEVTGPPADEDVATYRVRVTGEDVEVDV